MSTALLQQDSAGTTIDISPHANRFAELGWGVHVLGGWQWQEEMGRPMLLDSFRGFRVPMVGRDREAIDLQEPAALHIKTVSAIQNQDGVEW